MNQCPILFSILLSFFLQVSFGQIGLFESNSYEFRSETAPTNNKKESIKNTFMIDFISITNKHFTWRLPRENDNEEDALIRYNIISKVEEKYISNGNFNQTVYLAKAEILGVEADEKYYLYKIDDLNDNSLNIVIYSIKFQTRFIFYNLTRI